MSFRNIKRAFGYGSPSPERDATTGRVIRRRVESPPPLTDDQLRSLYSEREAELARIQAQEALVQQRLQEREASQFAHNQEVSDIIDSLNEYLGAFFQGDVNVDMEDPNIRYIVGMIVTSRNVGQSVAERLARSKPLLIAVASVIVNRATAGARGLHNQVTTLLPIISTGLLNSGRFLGRVGMASGRAAYGVMSSLASSAASGARNYFSGEPVIQNQRAISPPRGMQSMREMASRAYESITTGLPLFYNALYNVLQRVSSLLLPCAATAASMAAAGAMRAFGAVCKYLTPRQAVERAVSEVVNRATPPQQEEEESICAICMEGEQDNPEPLGYVIRHHAVRSWHPNRFHRSCLQGCQNKCPICRAAGPVWGMQRRERQGGGGLKKYRSRSRSRSRSKSKTRRLRKSRKPRKSCKSRKPRSLSYRRK